MGTIGELLLTTKQLTSRKANIAVIIPYYMIRKIRMNINGQQIGEIAPENKFENMPHWAYFHICIKQHT